jgi:hypothetical protein
MPRVVVLGSGTDARNVWEALAKRGTADIAGFVSLDSRLHGQPLLGTTVHPPEWLAGRQFDLVAIAGEAPRALLDRLHSLSVPADCVVPFPAGGDPASLSAIAAEWLPDPLSWALGRHAAPRGLRFGIFGTGAAAMKAWEALAEIDAATTVWFADNNPHAQGKTLLWVDVIAPARIREAGYDFIVVGSMSRDPIVKQLHELGVPGRCILTPNVASASMSAIREELEHACALFEVQR